MNTVPSGKHERFKKLSNARGIIAALAIDQRGPLKQGLAETLNVPPDAVSEDMATFKACVTQILGPHATAVLLDVDYGTKAIALRPQATGLLLAYEKWGYDTSRPGRMQETLAGWNVQRLMDAGADCIKILLFYTPFEREETNETKRAWIRGIGEECLAHDIPFCLEPIAYDVTGGGEGTAAFAKIKPVAVAGYMQEFSKPDYRVDLLKVEIPVNLAFVEGTRACGDGPAMYSRAEALDAYREAAATTHLPFVYLSAGVNNDVFLESLELAGEAGVAFNGVLCGRATWKEAVPIYGKQGVPALEDWLHEHGVRNIQRLNDLLSQTASPWWNKVGEKPGTA
jgi:tagatose 1,6-diphosphate aldolase